MNILDDWAQKYPAVQASFLIVIALVSMTAALYAFWMMVLFVLEAVDLEFEETATSWSKISMWGGAILACMVSVASAGMVLIVLISEGGLRATPGAWIGACIGTFLVLRSFRQEEEPGGLFSLME